MSKLEWACTGCDAHITAKGSLEAILAAVRAFETAHGAEHEAGHRGGGG